MADIEVATTAQLLHTAKEIDDLLFLVQPTADKVAGIEGRIPDLEAAANAANTAATSANEAASGANTAANSANTAAESASTATTVANTAAGEATAAANNANTAAESANNAATEAYKVVNILIKGNGLSHNGIPRGDDLTNVYTDAEMYEMIHSGKFDDLFLGDYFTKSITTDVYTHFVGEAFESGTTYYEMGGTLLDRTWTETADTEPQSSKVYCTKTTKTEDIPLMYGAFDHYWNVGDTPLATHHAVLIPRNFGFATPAKMNPTNTTAGGYYNSDMHCITLPCYAKSIKAALNGHLLSHRTILPNAVNTSTPSMAGAGFKGASNNWAWNDVELQLMSEPQVYGTTVWSSSAYDFGVDYKKLPVFDFINPVQYGSIHFWLRSVASSTYFAFCSTDGRAYSGNASYAFYVRPLILFG